MPNYQDGQIYTIRCKTDNTLIYVGSTTMTLSRRMAEHRNTSKTNNIRKLYSCVNGNWDDWYIELYEECPCENKEQLCRREGEIIREIATLNYEIAGRTKKEYCEDNAEKMKLYQQEYRENNAEKLKLRDQKYYENNAEKMKLYQQEYRENNAEKMKLYKQEYYENNKEKILEKITCDCGCMITQGGLTRHLKTKRHIEGINPV